MMIGVKYSIHTHCVNIQIVNDLWGARGKRRGGGLIRGLMQLMKAREFAECTRLDRDVIQKIGVEG